MSVATGTREVLPLWPARLAEELTDQELLQRYGDIPHKPRLRIDEVCAALDCERTHIYRMIYDGTLDAVNIARDKHTRPLYRVLRYSVIEFLERSREGAA